jgi:hypothetical protein
MAIAKEQIRQIITDNNFTNVADVYAYLKEGFKDILQELMEAEMDAVLGYEKNQKGIKGNNCKTPLEERTKTLQVAKTFLKYRQEDLKRILSDDGILFRTNRSIQAEGSFGDLKQDMQFRRYLSKGTSNVLAESILLAMARNINKLHNKIQKNRTGTHLFPLKSA